MTPLRPPRFPVLLAATALAATACRFSFDNPADGLSVGEVGGKAAVPGPGSSAGVAVSVQGSVLDQASRPSGRFGILPLPRGRHVVLLRQGLARAAQREASLGYGADGKVEGRWLGELDLPRAVALTGVLTRPIGTESATGVVVDEVTGLAVSTDGAFQLEGLAVGNHRILAATRDEVSGDTWIGGPVLITVAPQEEGTAKTLAGIPLRAATADTGHLYFRVAPMADGLDPALATVHVTDAAGAPVAVPAADSNGDRDVTLPEGAYFVEVGPPSAFAGAVPAPERRVAVVVADDAFDLGTFYLADDATIEAAARSCHADADCAPGSCTAGICSGGYTPPAVAPATAPLCDDLGSCGPAPGPCDWPGQLAGPGAGSCVQNPVTTFGVCVPCSTSCTLDGVAVLTASACAY
jgi:hypothetical protein